MDGICFIYGRLTFNRNLGTCSLVFGASGYVSGSKTRKKKFGPFIYRYIQCFSICGGEALETIRQSGKSQPHIKPQAAAEVLHIWNNRPLWVLMRFLLWNFKNHHLSRYINRPWSCGLAVLPNSWLSCQISPFKSHNVTMHILELFSPNDFAAFIQQGC